MSKLTELFKKRKAFIAAGTKAFQDAEAVDEEIMELIDRAREVFDGAPSPRRQKSQSRPGQTRAERDVDALFIVHPPKQKKGRTPSLQEPIRKILIEAKNRPITQDSLLSYLMAAGVPVKGKKPKSTLSAHVSYLIKRGFLVRVEDKIALKQPSLVPAAETAARTH